MDAGRPVGELVREAPACAVVFDALGIDFCCEGSRTLAEVCGQQGLDTIKVIGMLERATRQVPADEEPVRASLSGLCDEIERTHHAYLRQRLPQIMKAARRAADVYGESYGQLARLQEVLEILEKELMAHVAEEVALFPLVRAMDTSRRYLVIAKGELHRAIRVFEREHDGAGDALKLLRELTNDFSAPAEAPGEVRSFYRALHELHQNVRAHIHKENNILFPGLVAEVEET